MRMTHEKIVEAEGIPPLLHLLSSRHSELQQNALSELLYLSNSDPRVKQWVVDAGGLPILKKYLLRQKGLSLDLMHFRLLNVLAQSYQDEMREAGFISELVSLLDHGNTYFRRAVVSTLIALIADHPENQQHLKESWSVNRLFFSFSRIDSIRRANLIFSLSELALSHPANQNYTQRMPQVNYYRDVLLSDLFGDQIETVNAIRSLFELAFQAPIQEVDFEAFSADTDIQQQPLDELEMLDMPNFESPEGVFKETCRWFEHLKDIPITVEDTDPNQESDNRDRELLSLLDDLDSYLVDYKERIIEAIGVSSWVCFLNDKNPSIQVRILRILIDLVTQSQANQESILKAGVVDALMHLTRSSSLEVQFYVSTLLGALAFHYPAAQEEIRLAGGVYFLMRPPLIDHPSFSSNRLQALYYGVHDNDANIKQLLNGFDIALLKPVFKSRDLESKRMAFMLLSYFPLASEKYQTIVHETGVIESCVYLLKNSNSAESNELLLNVLIALIQRHPPNQQEALNAGLVPVLLDFLRREYSLEVKEISGRILVYMALNHSDIKKEAFPLIALASWVSLLSSPDLSIQLWSVSHLQDSIRNPSNNLSITQVLELIDPLVHLLKSDSIDIVNQAANSVASLILNSPASQTKIVESGAISSVMYLLNRDDPSRQEAALLVFQSLIKNHLDYQARVVEIGAIPRLLVLMKTTNSNVQIRTLTLLRCLVIRNRTNQTQLVKAGALTAAITLLKSANFRLKNLIILFLCCLLLNHPENQIQAGREGVIPLFLSLFNDSVDSQIKMVITNTLMQLIFEHPKNISKIQQEQSISHLVTLLGNASVRLRKPLLLLLISLCKSEYAQKYILKEEQLPTILLNLLSCKNGDVIHYAALMLTFLVKMNTGEQQWVSKDTVINLTIQSLLTNENHHDASQDSLSTLLYYLFSRSDFIPPQRHLDEKALFTSILFRLNRYLSGPKKDKVRYILKRLYMKNLPYQQAIASHALSTNSSLSQLPDKLDFFFSKLKGTHLEANFGADKEEEIVLTSPRERQGNIDRCRFVKPSELTCDLSAKPLGGAFGNLFFGHWGDRPVVLKCLHQRELSFNVIMALNASKLGQKPFSHPNVLIPLGICFAKNCRTLVMRPFDQGSLFDILARNPIGLELSFRLGWAYEIACGLSFLHERGVLHGNLKSTNIFFDGDKPVLSHFGLFKTKCHDQVSQTDQEKQKEEKAMFWLAPDFSEGSEFQSAFDIYSIGVVFWELAEMKPPWRNPLFVSRVSRRQVPSVMEERAELTDALQDSDSFSSAQQNARLFDNQQEVPLSPFDEGDLMPGANMDEDFLADGEGGVPRVSSLFSELMDHCISPNSKDRPTASDVAHRSKQFDISSSRFGLE